MQLHLITAASKILGSKIRDARLKLGMTPLQLGKAVNDSFQQITKYENGEFIPLAKLESLGDALGMRIPKKIIRRISFLRKLEVELQQEQEELAEIYSELFLE